MVESGTVRHLWVKWYGKETSQDCNLSEPYGLGFLNVVTVFMALGVAAVLSIIILLIEILSRQKTIRI